MLIHPMAHKRFKLIFPAVSATHTDHENAFGVDIDDCDCDTCEQDRAALMIQQYATIELNIDVGAKRITQRLTPEEALELSDLLRIYCTELTALAEEMAEEDGFPEECA